MRCLCTLRRRTVILLSLVSILVIAASIHSITKEDDEERVDLLVQRIQASKWISYFPHIRQNLHQWHTNARFHKRVTSPEMTKIRLLERKVYKKGDTLNAQITAFDELGERKRYGGDFFIVTLRRVDSPFDGISCQITDTANGCYFVACFLPWSGPVLVSALLVHPSEIIFELMKRYSSTEHFGMYIYTKMLNSNNEEERTICTVAFPDKRRDEVCNYSNPTHGEQRESLKPLSGECSAITWQQSIIIRGPQAIYRDYFYFREGRNFYVPIRGTNVTVHVVDDNAALSLPSKFGKVSKDPMTPTGWFYNSTWVSFIPKTQMRIKYDSVKPCVINKRLYFVGDSTIRIIYHYILSTLKMKEAGLDNSVAWSRGRDAEDVSLNLTMQYRSHGPPLINPGPEDSRPYISDTLDAITTGGKGTIVILTLGYHFLMLTPDVFLNRLRIIKDVIKNLMRRLPGSRIIVKGLHYHARDKREQIWLTYRLEVLLRHELGIIPGVMYLEFWDKTLVYKNGAFHPNGFMFERMTRDVVAAIC